PDRKRRSGEAINNDEDGQRGCTQGKGSGCMGSAGNPFSAEDRQDHKEEAESGGFQHASRPQVAQINAHEQRDRDGHGDREGAPGTGFERVHNNQRNHSQQKHDDADDRDERDGAGSLAYLLAGHLAEGFAVTTNGEQQDHEVLHAAAEDRAGKNPDGSGKITELSGEHRPNQRSGTGNGCEMMAEDHPLVGGHEIAPIFQALSGSGALGIKAKNFRRDKFAVETITQRITAQGGDNDPHGIDSFAAAQSDGGKSKGAQGSYGQPEQEPGKFHGNSPAKLCGYSAEGGGNVQRGRTKMRLNKRNIYHG